MRLAKLAALALVGASACGDASPAGEPAKVSETKHSQPVAEDPPVPATSLRTSKPSANTKRALASVQRLEVLTFFAPGPVRDQVFGYFTELGVEVRELDQLAEPQLAKELRIRDNGAIVLRVGDQVQRVWIPDNEDQAGHRLAQLDNKVAGALTALVDRGVAVVLHAAGRSPPALKPILNDVATSVVSRPATNTDPLPDGTRIVVFIDDGTRPIAPAFARVAEHVSAGNSALIALEPAPSPEVNELLQPLGAEFDATVLVATKNFARATNSGLDRANLVTDKFGDHPAVQSLAPGQRDHAVVFMGAGSFGTAAGASTPPAALVKSRPDAFADANNNFTLDAPDEAAAEHTLAVALEKGRARVAAFSDASWLDHRALNTLKANQVLLVDVLMWLDGDVKVVADEAEGEPQLTAYPVRPR